MKDKNKVLILDDDKFTLEVLNEALTYEKFDVEVTSDSDSFYKALDEFKPDVVLIDFLLPGINGGEICHELKNETKKKCSFPVFLMSAYPRVFLSLGTYGCDEFIAKPFDLFILVDKIKNYTVMYNTDLKLL